MSKAIADAFDAKLRGSTATHDDVLRLYPPPTARPAEARSLGQVHFYADFMASPDEVNARSYEARAAATAIHGAKHVNAILDSNKHHELKKHRSYDFRLTDEETRRLEQHGFVVSRGLACGSFGSMYFRLYTNDMPVFITSDSVLHAWHYSFDSFLLQLESEALLPLLDKVLTKALGACGDKYEDALGSQSDIIKEIYGEVELYLAVAHRLLHGNTGSGMLPPLRVATKANRLSELLELAYGEELTETAIFGSPRLVDFSLFKPRGHYTKTADLQRFFRAMTWLGTIDFRIDGSSDSDENAKASERHQLQCACMLVHVLDKAGVMPLVKTLHETIAAIAGDGAGADSMTPMQLHAVLIEGKGSDNTREKLFGPESEKGLTDLQEEIANRGLGAQAISGHPMKVNPGSKQPTRPPTAFAFVGQQFVWSAFVFSKLVFDQVIDGETGQKVPRRMVSAVDAAFALFGNNVAGIEIAKRMKGSKDSYDDERVEFRDGLPYAPSLIAAREVVDEAMEKASADPGSCSLALLWQLALRELSRPSAHGDQVFQSETWQKRQMNTQIASFAQLRHDTLLYAKQACTAFAECEYPAGFVDPYPSFWTKMQQLAERTATIVASLKEAFTVDGDDHLDVFDRADWFFRGFRNVTGVLGGIAVAQAAHEPLSDRQTHFLKEIIEKNEGSGGDMNYDGWYPSLFYSGGEDSCERDHLVADIHTDAPSDLHGDPGGILHLGVGDVNLGFFIVDDMMYAGPVFSHYEFVTPINERLTDEEFSGRLAKLEAPRWAAQSFLAPLDPSHKLRVETSKPRIETSLDMFFGDSDY